MTQGSISALIAKQWKNWSNGKQREKVNNTVLFYQATHDKLIAEFPKYKLITPFVLSKRFWVQSNIGVQATDSSGVDAMLGFPTGFYCLLSSCRCAAAVVVMTFSASATPHSCELFRLPPSASSLWYHILEPWTFCGGAM
ncbi:uncharacterized protein [Lolium perenne]|uniref:uncharacterized protein isoform X2 n=1 Tax=Lolium perenne TaxID=4522 RepID=UPI003A999EEB